MGSSCGFSGVEVLEQRLLMSAGHGGGGAKPGPTQITSYYVSPLGKTTNTGTQSSPWPTVAYALGKVGGGKTIILEPGTYAPIVVPVGDGGTSTSPTVIVSQNKWQAVIDGTLNPSVAGLASQSASGSLTTNYVTFDGLKVIHAGTYGINLGGNWDIVQNCWVTGSKLSGISELGNSSNTIQNNLIENNGTSAQLDSGIYAYGSGLVISGNIVRHNAGYGMQFSSNLQNSTVSGNLVYGQLSQVDITVSGAADTFTNNILLSCDNVDVGSAAFGGMSFNGTNPVAAWSGNKVEPTISGATLDSISSSNVADYSSALSLILPAAGTQDLTAPSASVLNGGLSGSNQAVWVRYTDNQSLALQRVSQFNMKVTGPGAYSASPQSVARMLLKDSRTLDVTYALTTPSGGWTSANTGNYSVSLQSGQIADVAGNYAAACTIAGGFSMNFGVPGAYYVSPTGVTTNTGTQSSPWPTVAYALSKVGGGHTIILEPGTYAPILVPLGYGGTSANPTVIQSQVKWQAVIDGTLNPAVEGIASAIASGGLTTDYVTFDGFKVIHAGTFGINLGGNWNIAQNCWVTGSKLSGIDESGNNNDTIQNNLIEYNGTSTQSDNGIYAYGSGLVISGNIVRHNSGSGIQLPSNPQNYTISGNLVYGQQSQADMLFSGTTSCGNNVTNNTLLDSATGGILAYGPNPVATWSGDRVEPAISGASLDSISSNNVADYANALALILQPLATTDVTPPTAKVTDSGVYAGNQMVMVTYTDDQSLALSRLSLGNVTITGPGGYSAPAQSIALTWITNSRTVTVMYTLAPPSGGWTTNNNGSFSMSLQSGQICDLAGNYAAAGVMSGSFSMTFTTPPPPPPPPPPPAGYYVSPTGSTTNTGTQSSPWPTVAYALSKVGGGHTIILEPGTYAPILVPRTYGGTSASPTVIESQYKWQAIINGALNPAVEAIASECNGTGGNTDYVTFDGFKVLNSGNFGINLGGNWDTAENCWVTGSKSDGVAAFNVNHTTIQNNLLENNGTSSSYDHGIYAGGTGLIVTGNVVRHNSGVGIQLSPNPVNCTVSGNLIYGQKYEADMLFSGTVSAGNIVTNNTLLDDPAGGILIYGPNPFATWSGNRVEPTIIATSLDGISSNIVADYANAVSLILPPLATTDVTPPTAKVTDCGLYAGNQMVMVTYSDNQSLALSGISPGNVVITGPAGYTAPARSIAMMWVNSSGSLVVMYNLAPPTGGWTSLNSGSYGVTLQTNQISDLAGNYVLPGSIGTFKVTAA